MHIDEYTETTQSDLPEATPQGVVTLHITQTDIKRMKASELLELAFKYALKTIGTDFSQ